MLILSFVKSYVMLHIVVSSVQKAIKNDKELIFTVKKASELK